MTFFLSYLFMEKRKPAEFCKKNKYLNRQGKVEAGDIGFKEAATDR